MKKGIIFFILFITILVLTISPAQAAEQNYSSLKNEYIKNHPGQAIIPYPWEPSTSIRVLPFNYEVPADPANNFSITACRNQFESASFILNARKDLSGININVPNLYDGHGNNIPADAINVRTVKVWYQAAENDVWVDIPGFYLAPELLLKDDSLINVDYVNKINYLKVTINGTEQYIDISNPNSTFPSNAQIHDTPSLQPFSLKANENKQIWLTVHVPEDTSSGEYYGNIIITAPSETPVMMNFSVTVLPFELEPSPIEYSLYYYGLLPETAGELQRAGINHAVKSPEQYSLELQNMKDHGVLYPTNYIWYAEDDPGNQTLRLALSLRNQTGLPTDHIYLLSLETGNSTSAKDLTLLERDVNNWKKVASQFGYREVYSYGIDEARGEVLRSERPAWQTVHKTGAKVFVAVSDNTDAVNIVGDLLDVAVVAGPLNTTQAAQWHGYGKRIFSYANPQVGVENPEIYRENYGFALWNAEYDGAMNFAYQYGFGHIWNDYDSATTHYRDHVFAYPTSNGVIDTVQWEGWREGVDDTRYLATSIKLEGSDTSARAIVSDSLSKGEEMAPIREKIIAQITVANKKTKVGIYNGAWKLDVNGNGLWDSPTIENAFQFGLTGDIPVIGDWNGDGKDDIGIFRQSNGLWSLDSNGNSAWDVSDKGLSWGLPGDIPVIGDWNGDGKDDIGIFRPSNGIWSLDSNGNSAWDVSDKGLSWGLPGDIPVIGDWNGDGKDDIGIFRPSNGIWSLDSDGDFAWEGSDKSLSWGLANDKPVIGNWNGDGKDDIGIFRPGNGMWSLDSNGNFAWEGSDKSLSWGLANDKPVIGDWNGDGKEDIGIFRPSKAIWSLDSNGNYAWEGTDKSLNWGQPYDIPVVGNWNGG
jgi:hypothetical protein